MAKRPKLTSGARSFSRRSGRSLLDRLFESKPSKRKRGPRRKTDRKEGDTLKAPKRSTRFRKSRVTEIPAWEAQELDRKAWENFTSGKITRKDLAAKLQEHANMVRENVDQIRTLPSTISQLGTRPRHARFGNSRPEDTF